MSFLYTNATYGALFYLADRLSDQKDERDKSALLLLGDMDDCKNK